MMTSQIEHVFGRGRLKMATGEHVEVYREAVAPGERRRYTKRFLATGDADFGQWTEREWRILARLIGHGIRCVPDVVQFDGGAQGGVRLVQTYDAGVTVDQWATLLPVSRGGIFHRHVFEDCAHWWSLAHCCLGALDEIHSLGLVHLDIKGDNICIPYGPPSFDPDAGDALYPIFQKLALIDFAFSVVSGEKLSTALPIGWQKDYDYQSPRLVRALDAGRAGDLQPTRDLDWRCDLYSLAAMLKRYLPGDPSADATGWTPDRFDDARTLIFRLREYHDRDIPHWRPHQQLMDYAEARLGARDLVSSLDQGWQLSRDVPALAADAPVTPMTRIAPAVRAPRSVRVAPATLVPTAVTVVRGVPPPPPLPPPRQPARRPWRATAVAPMLAALVALAAPPFIGDPEHPLIDLSMPGTPDAARSLPNGATRVETAAVSEPPTAVAAASPAALGQGANAPATAAPTTDRPNAAMHAEGSAAMERKSPDAETAAPPPPRGSKGRSKIAEPSGRSSPKVASYAPSVGAHSTRSPPPLQLAARPPYSRSTIVATPAASQGSSGRAITGSSHAPASTPKQDWPNKGAPAEPTMTAQAPSVPAEANGRVGEMTPNPAGLDSTATSTTGLVVEGRSNQLAATARSQGTADAQSRHASSRWQTLLANLGDIFRVRSDRSAPVEERRVLPTSPATASALLARSAPSENVNAHARLVDAPSAPEGASNRAGTTVASAAPAVVPERVFITPSRPAEAPAAVPSATVLSLPEKPVPAVGAEEPSQDALVIQARRMLVEIVPRVAAQAQPDVARVLGLAANADQRSQQQALIEAANAKWLSDTVSMPASDFASLHARSLHEDARHSFASGRVADALNTQLRAFAANPRDPDVAAYLAWLHIQASPAQPEVARQLAVYALSISGRRRSTRYGDWDLLAISSALTGRDVDATKAFLVEVALTTSLDHTCQTALGAYATYGERLRVPVETMLNRVNASGRISPYCDRRPAWNSIARAQ
jgi:serine/threonine protein kinase